MENKSIDLVVVKSWAEKLPQFREKYRNIVDAIALVYDGRTPQYYDVLFSAELKHYLGLPSMTSDAEVKRYAAVGALLAYSANKILESK